MVSMLTTIWGSFWTTVWNTPWDFYSGVSEFIPPLPASVLQHLDGTKEDYTPNPDYKKLIDTSGLDNFGLYDTVNDLYNLNPNNDLDLIASGILNAWLDRSGIAGLHNSVIRFLTPIAEESTLPADKVRSVIYLLGTTLNQFQINSLVSYIGRETIVPAKAISDDTTTPILDDFGNYITTD